MFLKLVWWICSQKGYPRWMGWGDSAACSSKSWCRRPQCWPPGSLKLEGFIHEFPERYFQVGGWAKIWLVLRQVWQHAGKIPFITSFAAFNPGLNYSQIRLAAMSHLPLKVVGSHYGLNVGPDGASAQMEGDIAMMRAPQMSVFFHRLIIIKRFSSSLLWQRGMIQTISAWLVLIFQSFSIQLSPRSRQGTKLLDGKDVTIIATGSMVYESLQVAQMLIATGKSVDFLNIHTIKPLDRESIVASAQKTGKSSSSKSTMSSEVSVMLWLCPLRKPSDQTSQNRCTGYICWIWYSSWALDEIRSRQKSDASKNRSMARIVSAPFLLAFCPIFLL